MCQQAMPTGDPENHRRRVLRDLVFSGGHDKFTAGQMSGWLGERGVEMSPSEVRRALAPYVEAGMLRRRLAWYVVPVSHGDWRLDGADGTCPA